MHDNDTALGTSLPTSSALAEHLRQRLASFLAPLLLLLDAQMDARLVHTFHATLGAILTFRQRACGLLLSELGGFLLDWSCPIFGYS